MSNHTLADLTALEARDALQEGRFSSEELVAACLDRIAAEEERVRAWAFVDPALAIEQARAADLRRKEGQPLGALHGLPVAIKDIIDTADMPTEDGTVLHAGRRPYEDAAVVSRLRAAGAIILGKTVTTELATYAPGKTRNPHNVEHTPGGSSSGSAAAVAARMVPLAVGTQTNGSVLRPAAYCGVYGYKPTYGLISRHGILRQSPPLDQVGVMGRCIEDVALIAEQLMGYDENDPATRPQARPRLLRVAQEEPPMPPRLAGVKSAIWDQAEPPMREAYAEVMDFLGERAEPFTLPDGFADVWTWHATVMEADIARNYAPDYERGRDRMSESLRGQIERGRKVLACDYNDALERIAVLNRAMDEMFVRYDAILTPAAAGPAPRGLDSTGSPAFCTLWTFCGMPAITLPLLAAENGLPMGLQLVGPRGDDARLLRTARWLVRQVTAEDAAPATGAAT